MVNRQYSELSEKIKEILRISLTDNPQSHLNIMRLEAFGDFHDVLQRYYEVSNVATEAENILKRVCDKVRIMEQLLAFPGRGHRNFCVYGFGGF